MNSLNEDIINNNDNLQNQIDVIDTEISNLSIQVTNAVNNSDNQNTQAITYTDANYPVNISSYTSITNDMRVHDIQPINNEEDIKLFSNNTGSLVIGNNNLGQANSVQITGNDGLTLSSDTILFMGDIFKREDSSILMYSNTIQINCNSYMARNGGLCVYMYNSYNIHWPCVYTIPDMTNITNNELISGNLTTSQNGEVVGKYSKISMANVDDFYLVPPNFGIIVYIGANYTNIQTVNYKNTTNKIQVIAPTHVNRGNSIKIFFNDDEQLMTV